MALIFKQLDIGGYDKNFSYLIGDSITNEYALVDPDNDHVINKTIDASKLTLTSVILTHGHGDHVGITPMLNQKYNIPVYLHKNDHHMLAATIEPLIDLSGLDEILIGRIPIKIIHTPGHTTGSVSFLVENKLISGDTVFVGRCGKTVFPDSDPRLMIESIRKIKMLDDAIEIWPGHNYGAHPSSTIGKEKKANVDFLKVD